VSDPRTSPHLCRAQKTVAAKADSKNLFSLLGIGGTSGPPKPPPRRLKTTEGPDGGEGKNRNPILLWLQQASKTVESCWQLLVLIASVGGVVWTASSQWKTLDKDVKKIDKDLENLKSDFKDFKSEMKSDLKAFKSEVKSDLKAFKSEVKSEIGQLKGLICVVLLAVLLKK
jgi:hypothetical protein